jgi:hypothetical protein
MVPALPIPGSIPIESTTAGVTAATTAAKVARVGSAAANAVSGANAAKGFKGALGALGALSKSALCSPKARSSQRSWKLEPEPVVQRVTDQVVVCPRRCLVLVGQERLTPSRTSAAAVAS